LVHVPSVLQDPVVIQNTAKTSDSVDRHDSVVTVIEYRHDTTKNCDSVFTTTAKIQTVTTVSKIHDTIQVAVPHPFEVRDTIYQEKKTPIPYSVWKILGWLFLGLSAGAIAGFITAAVLSVGKKI
jgi:hypothetical protein